MCWCLYVALCFPVAGFWTSDCVALQLKSESENSAALRFFDGEVLEAPAGKYDMPKLDLSSVRPDRGLRWCLRAVMDPRVMAVYGAQRPPALRRINVASHHLTIAFDTQILIKLRHTS